MKAYYRELMKFVPHSIQIAEREDLRHLWKLEPYPCLDIFEDFYECFQNAPDIRTAFFKILPIEEIHIRNGGLVFSIGYKSTYPAGVATLDKGKQYKQQQNGLSTLPKTPPGCKKGRRFCVAGKGGKGIKGRGQTKVLAPFVFEK